MPAGPDRIQSTFDASVRWLSEHGVPVRGGRVREARAHGGERGIAARPCGVRVRQLREHRGRDRGARRASAQPDERCGDVRAARRDQGRNPQGHRGTGCLLVPDASRRAVGRDRQVPALFDGSRRDQAAAHRRVPDGCRRDCRERNVAASAVCGSSSETRQTATPVSDLLTVHEKPLHLFMVSRDLEYFAHVHPEASGNGRLRAEARGAAGRVRDHRGLPAEERHLADGAPRDRGPGTESPGRPHGS